MPNDIDIEFESEIGRELVDRLNLDDCGSISSITYAQDPFRNFDMTDGVPWTVISPMKDNHIRVARALNSRGDAELLLTMQLQQNVKADQALMEPHLQDWDALLNEVGKDEFVASVRDSRRHQYDPVNDRAQLICQAAIEIVPRSMFGRLQSSSLFDYRGQRYRKESESFAVLLRWVNGEEVTERVAHRFSADVVVAPVELVAS